MFSKLLKHDWKSNSVLLGILSLCALGAGVLGIFVVHGMIRLEKTAENANAAALGATGLDSLLSFIVIFLAIYLVAVQFINIIRFYKSRFTDEGYLTFTLPVNVHQIFLSSFLHILLWLVISVAVVIASAFMIIVIGGWETLQETAGILQDNLTDTSDTLANYPGYETYQLLSTIATICSVVYNLVLIMTSITLGAVLAKKHKILAAIGMYYGINIVVGLVTSILDVIPTLTENSTYYESYDYTNTILGITIGLHVVLTTAFYFISTGLMKKKLNLP